MVKTKRKRLAKKVRKESLVNVPLRRSSTAEEQSTKIFVLAGISILLIIGLVLFLFVADNDGPAAGQAVYFEAVDCDEGQICLMHDEGILGIGSSEVTQVSPGDEITFVVLANVGSSVSDINLVDLDLNFDDGSISFVNESNDSSFGGSDSQWELEMLSIGPDPAYAGLPSVEDFLLMSYTATSVVSPVSVVSSEIQIVELTFQVSSDLVEGNTFELSFGSGSTVESSDGTNLLDSSTFSSAMIFEVVDISESENDAPVILSIDEVGPDTTGEIAVNVIVGEPLSVQVEVEDADASETLTLSIEELAAIATYYEGIDTSVISLLALVESSSGGTAGTWEFNYDTSLAVVGETYSFVINVDDGEEVDSVSLLVTIVEESNSAPTITTIADDFVNLHPDDTSDVAFEYTVEASDVDGDPLTYSLVASLYSGDGDLFNLATIDSTTGVISWVANSEDIDNTYTFTVSVEDSINDLVTESFNLEVTSVNNPPAFGTIGEQVGTPGTEFTLTVVAVDMDSTDIDSLEYSMINSGTSSDTDGSGELVIDSSTGVISGWTPGDVTETYDVMVGVSDASAAEDIATFTISVTSTTDTSSDDSTDDSSEDAGDTSISSEILATVNYGGSELSDLTSLVAGESYTIDVVVSGPVDVDHLLIVQVSDSSGEIKSLSYQSMVALVEGDTESFTMSFTPDSDDAYLVEIFVWSDWPLNGGEDLLSAEGS